MERDSMTFEELSSEGKSVEVGRPEDPDREPDPNRRPFGPFSRQARHTARLSLGSTELCPFTFQRPLYPLFAIYPLNTKIH